MSTRAIYVYSVGARFVGPNVEGLPIKKFADSTLVVCVDARKLQDPADKPDFPLLPGYDKDVRDDILAILPEGWLDQVWNEQVLPKVNEFLVESRKFKYLQIIVMCDAGYQRSPAIAEALYKRLIAYEGTDIQINCFHLSADLAHWIITVIGRGK